MKLLDALSGIFRRNSTGELKHLTGSIDNSLTTLARDVKLLDSEFIINQSTGEWLDEWGSWFGIRKLLNESDEVYRNRIVAIIANPKSTISAIVGSTKSYLGDPDAFVSVYEPFNDIFKFTGSTFSGTHRYQDSDYYRMGVIDVSIESEITNQLRDTLNQIKSGGVKIYYTRTIQLPMQHISAIDEVESMYSVEIMYDLLAWAHEDIARYSASTPFQLMSGNQTTFYIEETETTLHVVLPPKPVIQDGLVEIEFHTPFTSNTHSDLQVDFNLGPVYVIGNAIQSDRYSEIDMSAVMARLITAGSEMTIASISLMTIDEATHTHDHLQQPVVSESMPV